MARQRITWNTWDRALEGIVSGYGGDVDNWCETSSRMSGAVSNLMFSAWEANEFADNGGHFDASDLRSLVSSAVVVEWRRY